MRSLLGRFHRPMSRGAISDMLTMNSLGDGSTLSLDFTTMGGVLDSRLTFSRAGGGTYVGADGYIYGVDSATSASLAIGTGSKSVTLTATADVDRRFQVGQTVYFSSGANNMSGLVTAYNASTQVITINATATTGSGSFTSWFVGNASPRFDYSPTNIGEPRGLLVEGSAVNLALRSSTMGSATYTTQEATMSTGVSVDPSNTASAPTMAAIPGFSYSSHLIYSTVGVSNATSYTLSVFAKANGYNRIGVCIAAGARYTAVFNLTGSGSFQTSSSTVSPAPTGTGYSITAYGNGWYRCSVTMTTADTTLYPHFMLVNDGAITFNVNAQATFVGESAKSIYIWGAQLELGSANSSHIPTGASTVTRAVDTAIIAAGTNFSSWYTGGTTGTFVTEWCRCSPTTTQRTVIATSDVSNQHLHQYIAATTSRLRLADKVPAFIETTNASVDNSINKGAFSYSGSVQSLCLNGGTVVPGTLTFTTAPTWLSIGGPSNNGTSITDTAVVLNNAIRKIKYFPTRLSDGQIQGLST